MKTFKEQLHLPVTMIDDSARMLAELKVVTETTRDRETMISIFPEVSQACNLSFHIVTSHDN